MRRLLKRGVYFKLTVTTTSKFQIKVHGSVYINAATAVSS